MTSIMASMAIPSAEAIVAVGARGHGSLADTKQCYQDRRVSHSRAHGGQLVIRARLFKLPIPSGFALFE